MNVVVFANQKGGVGKTTILVHMAFFLSEIKKRKVVVLDLDHQGNASFSLNEFSVDKTAFEILTEPESQFKIEINEKSLYLLSADSNLLKFEQKIELLPNLKTLMSKLEGLGVQDVLIDTTPALNNRLASALMVSTMVVTPIELEVYSLQGVSLMLQTISNISKKNEKMKFLGLLPSRMDTRNKRHKEHLEQLKEKYPTLIIPCIIAARSSIADAVASKVPVWRIKKTSARPASKEMKDFGEYLFKSSGGF